MRMDRELTRQDRLSAMLIVAAIALPGVVLAGMLLLPQYARVRYNTHVLTLWLVADAALLAIGLIVRENAGLSKPPTRRAAQRRRR
jgi:hypothetical protein